MCNWQLRRWCALDALEDGPVTIEQNQQHSATNCSTTDHDPEKKWEKIQLTAWCKAHRFTSEPWKQTPLSHPMEYWLVHSIPIMACSYKITRLPTSNHDPSINSPCLKLKKPVDANQNPIKSNCLSDFSMEMAVALDFRMAQLHLWHRCQCFLEALLTSAGHGQISIAFEEHLVAFRASVITESEPDWYCHLDDLSWNPWFPVMPLHL